MRRPCNHRCWSGRRSGRCGRFGRRATSGACRSFARQVGRPSSQAGRTWSAAAAFVADVLDRGAHRGTATRCLSVRPIDVLEYGRCRHEGDGVDLETRCRNMPVASRPQSRRDQAVGGCCRAWWSGRQAVSYSPQRWSRSIRWRSTASSVLRRACSTMPVTPQRSDDDGGVRGHRVIAAVVVPGDDTEIGIAAVPRRCSDTSAGGRRSCTGISHQTDRVRSSR